jgi:hypothetical protein
VVSLDDRLLQSAAEDLFIDFVEIFSHWAHNNHYTKLVFIRKLASAFACKNGCNVRDSWIASHAQVPGQGLEP